MSGLCGNLRPWALVLVVGLIWMAPLGAATDKAVAFTVLRDGERLGSHSVRISQEDDRLIAEIEIDLEVRLAFFTLFRYRHSNREVWQDGRLISLDSKTDDDGELYWVRARAQDDGLAVESRDGRIVAPADILPTSYWRPETIDRGELLDTQRGQIVQVSVEDLGKEPADQTESAMADRRYAVRGDLNLDIWYSQDGRWNGLLFEVRGSEIRYLPELAP